MPTRFQWQPPEQETCVCMARELDVPYLIAVLLWQRGVRTPEAAREFLNPQLSALPSPFLMKDMEKAVDLVARSFEENWRIYIHGDYDVDGITSTALLSRFFRRIGKKTVCYHPDRMTEGYGLQEEFIRAKAPVRGETSLLITVDCGISNVNEVKTARELGFKVIVTDHHLPGDELPPADAILNPRRDGCGFPFPGLAGVGVAFFLAYGIRNGLVERGLLDRKKAPNLKSLMDLVALGTVADVMPLTSTNRILVAAGLEVMNQPDCGWAMALHQAQNSDYAATTFCAEDISYRFGPRINAPGRLGNPALAFDLLSADDLSQCRELAAEIEKSNITRREYENAVIEQVQAECESQERQGHAAFVVHGEFHQGVIGIIASRMVDRYRKPIIIFAEDKSRLGTYRGSGRSLESVNLYEVIESCSKSIIQFGGHAMAAGLTIHKDNLRFFTTQFKSAVARLELREEQVNIINVDCNPSADEVLNSEFIKYYRRLEPFGQDNHEPVFMIDNPELANIRTLKNHLAFDLKSNGQVFRGIGFNIADKIQHVRNGPVQLAFKLKKTVYRGENRTELHVVDLLPAGDEQRT